MNLEYLKNFSAKKKKKSFFKDVSFTNKQKLSVGVLLLAIGYMSVFAQYNNSSPAPVTTNTLASILQQVPGGNFPGIYSFFTSSFYWIDIVKNIINYIIEAQTRATQTIAGGKFGNSNMFGTINNAVTIFAVIACGYKILIHYLKTERFDNVQAFTGFFSYFGVLILFLFSGQIVNRLVSVNSKINQSAINSIGSKINAELDQQIAADYSILVEQLKDLEAQYTGITNDNSGSLDAITSVPDVIKNRTDYYAKQASFYAGNLGKYIYFSFFGILITAVLAIPVFIMTLMVKVLLSVMTFGTKLVFLLAFIPGFENTWKTFMLNLLHILLWVPIFNAIIAFLLAIISATMVSGSMTGGQIVWLSIVAIVCAFQSISLTTSAAGVIINGAGAGMAGALGALSGMSAAAMTGQAISTGASLVTNVATYGAGSKLSKN